MNVLLKLFAKLIIHNMYSRIVFKVSILFFFVKVDFSDLELFEVFYVLKFLSFLMSNKTWWINALFILYSFLSYAAVALFLFFFCYIFVSSCYIYKTCVFIDRIYANNKHYMCAVFNKFINAFLANFKFNMCKFGLFMEVTSMTLIDLTL